MHRQVPRGWIVVLSALAAVAFAAICAETEAATGTPNVVIFVADDLGAMDVGFNNPRTFYETPHLDRLAVAGACFTSGYAANPVCSPTRYSLMTGKYPTRVGLTNWIPGQRTERFQDAPLTRAIGKDETTLAEAMKERDYRTAYVGKWHLGEEPHDWPEAHGFEINLGGYSAGAPASFFSPYKNPRLADGPAGEHLTARLAEESARLIRRFREEGKPFLIVHADYAVHNPVQAPAELIEKYRAKAERLGLQEVFSEEAQYHVAPSGPRRVRRTQTHAGYAALVEMMDSAVGTIVRALEENGVLENTVFVFVSDNGGLSTNEGGRAGRAPAAKASGAENPRRAVPMPTANDPLRAGKGWLYEGGLRVPFLVHWPAVVQRGVKIDAAVSTVDVMPTVLAAVGVDRLPKLDGVSLVPALRGDTAPLSARALFWHYPHYSNQGGFPGGAILRDGWKLIENYEDGGVMLYRLENDPGEQRDLAGAEPSRVKELRVELHAWYREVNAQFLRAVPGGVAPWRP